MQRIEELKTKLADAKAALTTLDDNITVMKTRHAEVSQKIATIDGELSTAQAAAKTAAKTFAVGDGSEFDLTDSQTVVASLTVKKAAFESALAAITEELTKLNESHKAAAGRVDRLTDMIYSRISEIELRKAIIFIKRSHTAFHKNKNAYMHRDYFSKAVADLVHHCRHEDSDKISQELATIYELDV